MYHVDGADIVLIAICAVCIIVLCALEVMGK